MFLCESFLCNSSKKISDELKVMKLIHYDSLIQICVKIPFTILHNNYYIYLIHLQYLILLYSTTEYTFQLSMYLQHIKQTSCVSRKTHGHFHFWKIKDLIVEISFFLNHRTTFFKNYFFNVFIFKKPK